MPSEFDLIKRYFAQPTKRAALGVGDDCALLLPHAGMQLAVSTDMLVEGRHFLSTVAPERLGHKALAVNLSDLAACGALPLAFTLALALPRADEAFVAPFAQGLLAGGDDYELLFTAPASRHADVLAAARSAGVPVQRCGRIEAGSGLRVLDGAGHELPSSWSGFDHFSA